MKLRPKKFSFKAWNSFFVGFTCKDVNMREKTRIYRVKLGEKTKESEKE